MPLMCYINDRDIVIAGGISKGTYLKDAFLFNVDKRTARKLHEEKEGEYHTWGQTVLQ